MKRNVAVFCDRDGVINPDVGYPHTIEDAVLFPDVVPAFREMQQAGYLILVVANQSGIARGFYSRADVRRFNRALCTELQSAGVRIGPQDFYFCPHSANSACECRKPKPGLLLQVAKQWNLDLARCFCVGDKESDVQAGRNAGTFAILLDRNGRAKQTAARLVCSSLIEVATFISQRTCIAKVGPPTDFL
jgi:histidinol-phosphate phosphatase family protein